MRFGSGSRPRASNERQVGRVEAACDAESRGTRPPPDKADAAKITGVLEDEVYPLRVKLPRRPAINPQRYGRRQTGAAFERCRSHDFHAWYQRKDRHTWSWSGSHPLPVFSWIPANCSSVRSTNEASGTGRGCASPYTNSDICIGDGARHVSCDSCEPDLGSNSMYANTT
jgi:hypothetical protein